MKTKDSQHCTVHAALIDYIVFLLYVIFIFVIRYFGLLISFDVTVCCLNPTWSVPQVKWSRCMDKEFHLFPVPFSSDWMFLSCF